MSVGFRLSALACLIFVLACAGQDDGDGGNLLSNEEERVCAWIDQITPLVDEVGGIDITSNVISNPVELADLRRRIDQASPPNVQHLQASRALREFQEALSARLEAVVDCAREMQNFSPTSFILGNTNFEDAFEDVETAGTRVNNRAGDVSDMITRDLEDHPQSQRALLDMISAVNQNFGEMGFNGFFAGGGQRTLPSQLGASGGNSQYQRLIPPGTIPTS